MTQELATDFETQLKSVTDSAERLRLLLERMRQVGIEQYPPDWKAFWLWRGRSLEVMKEQMAPAARSQGWSELAQLTREVRQLQQQYEEAGLFVAQQLTLALDMLVAQVQETPTVEVAEWAQVEPFSARAAELSDWASKGARLQLHLQRLAEVRAELAKTVMPSKDRARLWERVDGLEKQLVEARKELIATASAPFVELVTQWETAHFGEQRSKAPAYQLLDQIKHLQSLAKSLPLERSVFMEMRERLSRCWEKAKEWERQHRAKMKERRETQKAAPVQAERREGQRPARGERREGEERPRRPRRERTRREEGEAERPREARAERPRRAQEDWRQKLEQLMEQARSPSEQQLSELRTAAPAIVELAPLGAERERVQLQLQGLEDRIAQKLDPETGRQERLARARQRLDSYKRAAVRSGASMEQALSLQEAISEEKAFIHMLGG